MLKIAIDGLNAVQVTEEILAIEGIEGSYEKELFWQFLLQKD